MEAHHIARSGLQCQLDGAATIATSISMNVSRIRVNTAYASMGLEQTTSIALAMTDITASFVPMISTSARKHACQPTQTLVLPRTWLRPTLERSAKQLEHTALAPFTQIHRPASQQPPQHVYR